MKKALLVVMVVLFAAGAAYAKGLVITKTVGGLGITIKMAKSPPVVGDNNIKVILTEKGAPVTDARVKVNYSMPAMPGMPAMNYSADAAPKGNVYDATMRLSASGAWNVAVKVIRAGKIITIKFNVDAH